MPNLEELFRRIAGPDDHFDDEWCEIVEDRIYSEGRLVGFQDWDSGSPGSGAGRISVYLFQEMFFSSNDVGSYGPFDRFQDAAEAIQLFTKTEATTRLWVDPQVKF